MKKSIFQFIVAFCILICSNISSAQTIEFSDDFEFGTTQWTLTNNWGTSTQYFNSANYSLTESPTGNYGAWETSYATMATAVDLSSVMDANMSFWAVYDIETGFDYMYVDASGDGGSTWNNFAVFDGQGNLAPWTQYTYSLGGYTGSSNVLVRFRFVSDGFVDFDGMYIDDFEITSNNIDNSPPLILHTPPVLYEASMSAQSLTADMIDISGISISELKYTLDGGAPQTVIGVNTTGDEYLFNIPAQAAGVWVDYWFEATDASDSLNSTISDTSGYISGNYIRYENADIDFVASFGPASMNSFPGAPGAAIRVTLPGATDLVTALIRNYTDINNPNDSMLVHVWADAGGIPGADLITPVMVFPEATLTDPNAITRIDLRPYSAQLSNLSGDVFVGYTVPTGQVWLSFTQPGSAGRTFVDTSVWINITDDYHFRVVTDTFAGAPIADFGIDNAADPLIAFSDSSANSPTTWFWDFGDGNNSAAPSPSNTYSANGTYNVCLTATNGIGSNTKCKTVTVIKVPTVAGFSASSTAFCEGTCIGFTDQSTNGPTSWSWSFPGATPSTDSVQSPSGICYDTAGTYSVTLIATNSGGSDTLIMDSLIVASTCPPPTAAFTANATVLCEGDSITFTDQSTDVPTGWLWVLPGAAPDSSTDQNPQVVYNTAGTYDVTLIAINVSGSDTLVSSNMISVFASPAVPTVTASGATTFCQGDSVVLTSSNETSYLWSNGDTTQSTTITNSGSYTVTVSNAGGCGTTSAATTVTVNTPLLTPPTISASGPVSFCEGGSVTITSSSSSGNLWSTSETTQSITVTTTGSYTVSLTDTNGCLATSNPAAITVNPNPAVPIISQNVDTLTSSVTANSYKWYLNSVVIPGATSQSYQIIISGDYYVTVTSIFGCSTSSAVFSATTNGVMESVNNFSFSVFPNPSQGRFNLIWEAQVPGIYTVEVVNIIGDIVQSESITLPSKSNIVLNLSKSGAGTYFITIDDGSSKVVKRVVVH